MRVPRSSLRLLVSVSFALVSGSFASGQITSVTNQTSTPIQGAGHDYIKMLSETVNPSNGSASIRERIGHKLYYAQFAAVQHIAVKTSSFLTLSYP